MKGEKEMMEQEGCMSGPGKVKSECKGFRSGMRSALTEAQAPGRKGPIQQASSRCSFLLRSPPGYIGKLEGLAAQEREIAI